MYKLLIHNEKFYESEKYIGILCAGYGLSSILFFYLPTILYTKKIRVLLKIFGISALFQIGISYFAIIYWGLMGAIYAGLAVKALQIILSALMTKKIFIYDFNYVKIFGLPVLYATVNIILFHVYPEYSLVNYCLQFVGFSLLFYLIFKNEISAVYKQFFGKKVAN
jgi:O-antigen/teichoic acid export membrane protein